MLQEGLYPLLLQFIDAASGSQGIASMALELLAALPTHSALSERLAAALDGPGVCRQRDVNQQTQWKSMTGRNFALKWAVLHGALRVAAIVC